MEQDRTKLVGGDVKGDIENFRYFPLQTKNMDFDFLWTACVLLKHWLWSCNFLVLKLYFPTVSDVTFHQFSLRVVHITPSMENEMIQVVLFILSKRFINFPSNAFMCDSVLVKIVNVPLFRSLRQKELNLLLHLMKKMLNWLTCLGWTQRKVE